MSFLGKFFAKKEIEPRLLGDWFSDLSDEKTAQTTGDVKITFEQNGKLTYEITAADKKQYIFLTFYTKQNILITDQPSHPQIEETEFYFDEDNRLILKFDGDESRYLKNR